MSWWRRVVGRWQLEDALDAELRYHFDRLVDDYVASGLSERDARRRAREEFGGVEDVKDACRDAWGTRWVHDLAADLKFAARMLGRERALTVAAVLALALGIGVNTTLFTIANAICLRGLPIDAVDRVVDIRTRDDRGRPQPLSVAEFDAIRGARPPALAGVAAYTTRRATLRDADRAAERITVASVTADTFALIRQQPSFGRTFRADEDVSVGRVVMLGAEIWRTRYSGDAGLIGRSVLIDGTPTTVIGIMP